MTTVFTDSLGIGTNFLSGYLFINYIAIKLV